MVAPQVSILKVGVRFPCAAFDFLAQTLSIWIGQRDFYLESWIKVGRGGPEATGLQSGGRFRRSAKRRKAKSSSQYISLGFVGMFRSVRKKVDIFLGLAQFSGYFEIPFVATQQSWRQLASKHGESAFVLALFLCRYISKKPTSEEAVISGRYASSDPEIYQLGLTSPAATERNAPSLAKHFSFQKLVVGDLRSVSPVRQLSLESIRASPALKRMGL